MPNARRRARRKRRRRRGRKDIRGEDGGVAARERARNRGSPREQTHRGDRGGGDAREDGGRARVDATEAAERKLVAERRAAEERADVAAKAADRRVEGRWRGRIARGSPPRTRAEEAKAEATRAVADARVEYEREIRRAKELFERGEPTATASARRRAEAAGGQGRERRRILWPPPGKRRVESSPPTRNGRRTQGGDRGARGVRGKSRRDEVGTRGAQENRRVRDETRRRRAATTTTKIGRWLRARSGARATDRLAAEVRGVHVGADSQPGGDDLGGTSGRTSRGARRGRGGRRARRRDGFLDRRATRRGAGRFRGGSHRGSAPGPAAREPAGERVIRVEAEDGSVSNVFPSRATRWRWNTLGRGLGRGVRRYRPHARGFGADSRAASTTAFAPSPSVARHGLSSTRPSHRTRARRRESREFEPARGDDGRNRIRGGRGERDDGNTPPGNEKPRAVTESRDSPEGALVGDLYKKLAALGAAPEHAKICSRSRPPCGDSSRACAWKMRRGATRREGPPVAARVDSVTTARLRRRASAEENRSRNTSLLSSSSTLTWRPPCRG